MYEFNKTQNNSTIFLISDTHFNHGNAIKYCRRPFVDATDMNERLIYNWNSVVGENDIVYHLGDFILGSPDTIETILPRLNGHIILLRGNHDTETKLNKYAEHPDKITVKEMAYFQYNGLWFILCHFPIFSEDFAKLLTKNNPEVIMCHGHLHNETPFIESVNMFNVSADNIDFTPILINKIAYLYREEMEKNGNIGDNGDNGE